MLFQKEEKHVSKSLCSFLWGMVTTDLTFALTSLCPGAYIFPCLCHTLPSVSWRMLVGRCMLRRDSQVEGVFTPLPKAGQYLHLFTLNYNINETFSL